MIKGPIAQDRLHSSSIYSIIREILHTIGNIDFQTEFDLDRVEQGVTDEELKHYIKQTSAPRISGNASRMLTFCMSFRRQRPHQSFAA